MNNRMQTIRVGLFFLLGLALLPKLPVRHESLITGLERMLRQHNLYAPLVAEHLSTKSWVLDRAIVTRNYILAEFDHTEIFASPPPSRPLS